MDERKKLKLISSVEIMNTPMKKQRFIVDGMIYPGLHISSTAADYINSDILPEYIPTHFVDYMDFWVMRKTHWIFENRW